MKLYSQLLLLGTAMFALSGISAKADTVTYFTPSNSVEPADMTHPVDAEAIVTTGSGTVTVQLFDLLTAAQMHDAGQLLSDFFFTLNGTFGSVSNTNENTPTGTLVNLTGGSVGTIGKWGFSDSSSSGSTTFHLDDLNGGNAPAQTIIGGTPGESASDYTHANPSLTGNHNPFLQGEETFVLNIAGVTSSTKITGGVFSFGTTSGGDITGVATPEPRTTAVLLLGGLLMAVAFRRKTVLAK
jgi:hypothetical protein